MSWRHAPAGTQYVAGIGVATVLPDFDFETYSEAGSVWNPLLQKWKSLPGLSDQNRGLGAVGTRNYVQHPSFKLLSLAWNLKDGFGIRWWRPDPTYVYDFKKPFPRYDSNHGAHGCAIGMGMPCDCANQLHPVELLEYVEVGKGSIEAWGLSFEWQVWNFHCVPVLGWPPLCIDTNMLPAFS